VTAIASVASLSLFATACATDGSTPTGDEKPSGEVTIQVGSWWEDAVPKIQAAFAKDHPNITLNFQLTAIDGYVDKFTAAALGGTPPDIVDIEASQISTVAAAGLLEPLDDLASALPKDDFASAIWDASSYEGTQ
jgi:multiple sugar transport system substrate-binding protein